VGDGGVTFARLTCPFAVDTAQRANACEGVVVRGTGAADMVVACQVVVPAESTNCGTLLERALRDRMVKRMASIAPAENGERVVFLDCCEASEK
jgi:hypothetical protein